MCLKRCLNYFLGTTFAPKQNSAIQWLIWRAFHAAIQENDDKSVQQGECDSNISTVMIRFSARGAYLLLVPHGRALIQDRALI